MSLNLHKFILKAKLIYNQIPNKANTCQFVNAPKYLVADFASCKHQSIDTIALNSPQEYEVKKSFEQQ